MDLSSPGELVTVDSGSAQRDGIVFDAPSRSKVVVAIVDPAKGPGFRTVHPRALTERSAEGPDDRVLNLLIRRTPSPVRAAAGSGTGGGRGHAGHTRGAAHRTTGR